MGSIVNATSAYVEANGGNKVSILQQKTFPSQNYFSQKLKWTNSVVNMSYSPNAVSVNQTYTSTGAILYSMPISQFTTDNHQISMSDLQNSPYNSIQIINLPADVNIPSNNLQYAGYQYCVSDSGMIIVDGGYDGNFTVNFPISSLKPNTSFKGVCCSGYYQTQDWGVSGMYYVPIIYINLSTDANGVPNNLQFMYSLLVAGNGNGTVWNQTFQENTLSNANINDLATKLYNNPFMYSYSNASFQRDGAYYAPPTVQVAVF